MTDLTRVAVDVMTAEKGIDVVVSAVLSVAHRNSSFCPVLVGDQEKITASLLRCFGSRWNELNLVIEHAPDVIGHADDPVVALRKKKHSSTHKAIELVSQGRADCVVSCANTGALAAISRYKLKRVQGVGKLSITASIPSANDKYVHLCDVGASVDVEPQDLHSHAKLLSDMLQSDNVAYAPKIGLLNIGQESIKGNRLVKDTLPLLQSDSSLNFVGAVEPISIFNGEVDAVVCDGFVGNCVIKTTEASARMLLSTVKQLCKKSFFGAIAGWYLKRLIQRDAPRLNPCLNNGGILLGVNGVVIKSHGSATQTGIETAITHAVGYAKSAYAKKVSEWRKLRLTQENASMAL